MLKHYVSSEVATRLLSRWPSDCLGSIHHVLHHSSDKWVVSTERGRYFVKRTKLQTVQLQRQHGLLTQLRTQGIHVLVPYRVPRQPYLSVGRIRFQVFELLSPPSSRCHTPAAIGRALASLHSGLRQIGPSEKLPPLRLAVSPFAEVLRDLRAAELSLKSRLPLFSTDKDASELLSVLPWFIDQSGNRLKYFSECLANRLPMQTIHGDFHPGNVRAAEGPDLCIFDFDKMSNGPRAYDVAKFAACSYIGLNSDAMFKRAQLVQFLTAYNERAQLQCIEWAAIPFLMLHSQLSAIWVLQEYCQKANPEVDQYLSVSIRRLLWFARNFGQLTAEIIGLAGVLNVTQVAAASELGRGSSEEHRSTALL